MQKIIALLCFCFFFHLTAQMQNKINIVKYEDLEKKIQQEGKKLLVVNFWSTTCEPCVKELPDFMKVHADFNKNPDYGMLLVSLDRIKDLEKVSKFIKDKNITAEVVLLDDIKRMNTWIPKFDKDWQGEIPVTLFYKNGKKTLFHDGELRKEELNKIINNLK